MVDNELAYLAGLCDGEVSFSIQVGLRTNPSSGNKNIWFNPRISMTLKYGNDALKLLRDKFGGTVYNYADGDARWSINKLSQLIPALKALIPYLHIKRDVAIRFAEALDHYPTKSVDRQGGERRWTSDLIEKVGTIAIELNPRKKAINAKERLDAAIKQYREYEQRDGKFIPPQEKQGLFEEIDVTPIQHTQESKYAYLAGLMDAEGSFSISVGRGTAQSYRYRTGLIFTPKMSMTLRYGTQVLDELVAKFGGGIYTEKVVFKKWSLNKVADVLMAAKAIVPYLYIKKHIAERFIKALEVMPPRVLEQEKLIGEIAVNLNPHGKNPKTEQLLKEVLGITKPSINRAPNDFHKPWFSEESLQCQSLPVSSN